MTRTSRHGVIPLAALLVAAGALAACHDSGGGGVTPPPTLTAEQKAVLDEALQDALKTTITYEAAIEDLGVTEPFATVVTAEQDQVDAISALYARYGATQPASKWSKGNVDHFADQQQACMAAEEGEVASELMYARLLQKQLPSDMKGAFLQVRETARNQHRVAFRNCVGGTVAALTPDQQAGVEAVLQSEYAIFQTYDRVLGDVGNVAPFSSIRDAEWQHVGAAANLLVKRGITVPASVATADNVPRYTSLPDACTAAAEDELANSTANDKLMEQTLPNDVVRVFKNLRDASLLRHLPAMQACGGGGGGALAPEVVTAMDQAIQDEYRAHYTYVGVTEDVTPSEPFGGIASSEESHYSSIANLYVKHGLPVPASVWSLSNVPRFTTLTDACAAGVTGEIRNVAMYDELLQIALPTDVQQVFESLRAASNNDHLPAFQACSGT